MYTNPLISSILPVNLRIPNHSFVTRMKQVNLYVFSQNQSQKCLTKIHRNANMLVKHLEAHHQLDQGPICGQMQDVSTGKGKSSYYSAMPRARGLKFYYVIADPKVGE